MKTNFIKENNSWKATTEVPYDEKKTLEIRTYKTFNGYLVTIANISRISEDGSLSHYINSDFHTYLFSRYYSRVTKKTVCAQHQESLRKLEAIKEQAAQHYNKKEIATESERN